MLTEQKHHGVSEQRWCGVWAENLREAASAMTLAVDLMF